MSSHTDRLEDPLEAYTHRETVSDLHMEQQEGLGGNVTLHWALAG